MPCPNSKALHSCSRGTDLVFSLSWTWEENKSLDGICCIRYIGRGLQDCLESICCLENSKKCPWFGRG